jgi:alpha-tubulin suppressor-like RCC1 family protein
MVHKGIEYTVAVTATPSVWKWQFQIGDEVKSGKTETRISLLAIRRVQLRIDRELKKVAHNLRQ